MSRKARPANEDVVMAEHIASLALGVACSMPTPKGLSVMTKAIAFIRRDLTSFMIARLSISSADADANARRLTDPLIHPMDEPAEPHGPIE